MHPSPSCLPSFYSRTVEAFSIIAGLDDGVTGRNGGGSLVSTDGLSNDSTLKKRLSLPRFGGLKSFVNETETEAQSTASGPGSKLSGLQRKHDGFSKFRQFDSGLMKIPFLGYIPGIATLPPVPSLPIIRSFPGLSLIPGLGSTTAPSGIVADVTEPILAALPRSTTLHSPAQNSTLVASPRNAAIQSPKHNLTA